MGDIIGQHPKFGIFISSPILIRKGWRYQRGNQKRKSKNERQHNGQKETDKRINYDLKSILQKAKNRATRIPLKTGAPER